MKRFLIFLKTISVVFSAAVANSLWITKNDSWKIYLPIVLISISAFLFFKD